MPTAKSVCLEALDENQERSSFTRCVMLPGGEPGLALGPAGDILWQTDGPIACELYVSRDNRLILLCPDHDAFVEVRRAGRCLRVPAGKPVVLVAGDLIHVADHRYRLHVHGPARTTHRPSPLEQRARVSPAMLAAAIALGASVAGVACADSDGRENPIDAGQSDADASHSNTGDAGQGASLGTSDASDANIVEGSIVDLDARLEPIDVLDNPPKAIP